MLCLGHQLAALIPAVLIFSTLIHCVCKCLLSILIFNSELLFHVTPHSNSEIRQTLVEFLIAGYKYTHITSPVEIICLCHWQLLESKQQCHHRHHRRRRLCRPCRCYRYRHHCSHRHICRGAAQREPNRHKAAAWNFPVWGGGRGGRGQFVSARGCRTASSWCTIKLTWSLIFQDLNLMNIGRSNRDTSKSFCKAGLFVWGSWPLFKCSQKRSWARGCAWS